MATACFGSEERFVAVVGVDGSPGSIAALDIACAMASGRRSAVVHAVHAHRLDGTALYLDWSGDILDERRKLDELCLPRAHSGQVRVVRHVVLNRPEAAILELARDVKADVVVIGTRRRGGLERLLLGSLTDHVVHAAPCPVLVVPEKGHEAARARVPDEAPMRHDRSDLG